jgi:hypothetical protein
MSSQLNNSLWAQEFTEHASFDEDSITEDFEIVEFPLSFLTSRQDFLRARRQYYTPDDNDEELLETPQTPVYQVILRDLSISPPPLDRAPISPHRERVTIHTLRDAGFKLESTCVGINIATRIRV